MTSNVVQIWRAIDDDAEVPEAHALDTPKTLAIWRKGQQPHFQTLDADEAAFVRHLQAGSSIESTADTLAATALLLRIKHHSNPSIGPGLMECRIEVGSSGCIALRRAVDS